MNACRKYVVTQNQTASRERLMVMLFQAALRHMRQAAADLAGPQPAAAAEPLIKATDIVGELLATLNPALAPSLCDHLTQVYQFVLSRLTLAQATRESRYAQEALRVFAPVATAFEEVVARLGVAP